ncbi:hypothetical protein AVEN_70031-1, partial [Araneus ventricosus]
MTHAKVVTCRGPPNENPAELPQTKDPLGGGDLPRTPERESNGAVRFSLTTRFRCEAAEVTAEPMPRRVSDQTDGTSGAARPVFSLTTRSRCEPAKETADPMPRGVTVQTAKSKVLLSYLLVFFFVTVPLLSQGGKT